MNRNIKSLQLLLFCAASLQIVAGCSEHKVSPAAPTVVYFTEVSTANASRYREFTGTVQAHVTSDVGFRVGGKLLRREVETGDSVKVGQALAVLDRSDYDLGVVAADAQLKQAEAQARLNSADQDRFGRLTADGSIATADHERQRYRAEASRARLEQARSQLQVAKNLSSYVTLVAPYSSVVTNVRAEAGQVVSEGQPVISIARDGNREVVADIPEGMIADLKTLQVEAVPWEGENTPIGLKLREVSPIASQQGRVYRAKFVAGRPADGGPDAWPLGSTAKLVLRYPAKSAITLPLSAIVNAGTKTIVWAVDGTGAKLSQLEVKVVSSDSDSVSVEGLPERARIVTVGAQKLDAGIKVRAVERKPDEAMKVARSAK